MSSLQCGHDHFYYGVSNPALLRSCGWPRRKVPITGGWGTGRNCRGGSGLPSRGRPDAEYAEVVAALATCRRTEGRTTAWPPSFLAPTEIDWVDADCTEAARLRLRPWPAAMIAAISTPGQAALVAGSRVGCTATALSRRCRPRSSTAWARRPCRCWRDWLDAGRHLPEDPRRLAAMLAELPTDAAMQALIDARRPASTGRRRSCRRRAATRAGRCGCWPPSTPSSWANCCGPMCWPIPTLPTRCWRD